MKGVRGITRRPPSGTREKDGAAVKKKDTETQVNRGAQAGDSYKMELPSGGTEECEGKNTEQRNGEPHGINFSRVSRE